MTRRLRYCSLPLMSLTVSHISVTEHLRQDDLGHVRVCRNCPDRPSSNFLTRRNAGVAAHLVDWVCGQDRAPSVPGECQALNPSGRTTRCDDVVVKAVSGPNSPNSSNTRRRTNYERNRAIRRHSLLEKGRFSDRSRRQRL